MTETFEAIAPASRVDRVGWVWMKGAWTKGRVAALRPSHPKDARRFPQHHVFVSVRTGAGWLVTPKAIRTLPPVNAGQVVWVFMDDESPEYVEAKVVAVDGDRVKVTVGGEVYSLRPDAMNTMLNSAQAEADSRRQAQKEAELRQRNITLADVPAEERAGQIGFAWIKGAWTKGRVIDKDFPPSWCNYKNHVYFASTRTGSGYPIQPEDIMLRPPVEVGQTVWVVIDEPVAGVVEAMTETGIVFKPQTGKAYEVPSEEIEVMLNSAQAEAERRTSVTELSAADLADPHRKYVIELAERLYKAYGLTNYLPTQLTNDPRQSCHVYDPANRLHRLRFSRPMIATDAIRYWDYYSVRPVWGALYDKLNGLAGVHALVLHEFAHVLQTEDGGRWYGSVHNHIFMAKLRELIKKFPPPITEGSNHESRQFKPAQRLA
ncbi:MAG: hypothetical protein FOGNACKC_00763 [Anaerolineae bacterium]|nr:hypothetical protein [Anaerolineae bacterium]